MTRALLLSALLGWLGATLLLGELPGFRHVPLSERVSPYLPGAGLPRSRPSGPLSVASFHDVVVPLLDSAGDRLGNLLGVSEELAVKLERIHSPVSVSEFRMRELGNALVALTIGSVATVALRPPVPVTLLFLLGAPSLIFLVREHQIGQASAAWQERIFSELPIVTEQLGMLLGAGYSLGSALNRLSQRATGACAIDLQRVCGRIRQGVGERAALDEWAELAGVPALGRLVAILSLNREANDLSRLISEEARSVRREAHRRLIETIERRAQQVWIPVTVATLVPGVLFMVVPFVQAMRLFTAG
jgi:Flp pilus assembly protein TadB